MGRTTPRGNAVQSLFTGGRYSLCSRGQQKTFAAAVARIYHPGIKFDCVPVFDGAQGIGKSTLFKDLVGDEFYSETLSLTDMDDKSGAEKPRASGLWRSASWLG